jgi:hypothetical protein
MTLRVELNPETEARLIAEARAKGLPLEKVAEELPEEALAVRILSRADERGRISSHARRNGRSLRKTSRLTHRRLFSRQLI